MHADEQYYKEVYKGSTLPEAQLAQLLVLASLDIDALVHQPLNLASLQPWQVNLVRMATCEQAEHKYRQNDPSGLSVKSITSDDGSSIAYGNGETTVYSGNAKRYMRLAGFGSYVFC